MKLICTLIATLAIAHASAQADMNTTAGALPAEMDGIMGGNGTVIDDNKNNTQTPAEALCSSTKEYCFVACNYTEPQVNTCDPATKTWDCQCANGFNQTIIDQLFPIAFQECQESYTGCVNDCTKKTPGQEQLDCVVGCNTNLKCGTRDAPAPKSKVPANDPSKNGDITNPNSALQLVMSAGTLAVSSAIAFIAAVAL